MSDGQEVVTARIYERGVPGLIEFIGSPQAVGMATAQHRNGVKQNHQIELAPTNGADRTPLASGTNETEYRPEQASNPKVKAPLPDSTVRIRRRRVLTYGKSSTDPGHDETIDFYERWDTDKNRNRTFTALEVCYELGYSNPKHVKLLGNNLVRLGARRMLNLDGTRCRRRGLDVLTCIKD